MERGYSGNVQSRLSLNGHHYKKGHLEFVPALILYSQLSLSRTPPGPILSVCLKEMSVASYRESNKE